MEINKETAIKNIISNLEFNKIEKVMKLLSWTWHDAEEPPTIGELVLYAQKRLSETYDKCKETKKDYYTSCGGFATKALWNEELQNVDYLECEFVLTSWEYYEE